MVPANSSLLLHVHREHPPVPVRPDDETMEVDTRSLEKAPEAAFLKVAQRESIEPPITNTIDSGLMNRRMWLENQNQSHHGLGRSPTSPVLTTVRAGRKSPCFRVRIRRINLIRKHFSLF